MRPFVVGDDLWRVVRVPPDDPRLIDRTGEERLATADGSTHTICISDTVVPPLLDRVLLHEVTHAVTMSHGLLEPMRRVIPRDLWVDVEEWAAQLVENYGIEASILASQSIGRPICVRGYCNDRP